MASDSARKEDEVRAQPDSIVAIAKERNRLLQGIAQGWFDGNEDMLFDAVKRRQAVVDLEKAGEFQVGDTVIFNKTARPKYLQKGVEAIVQSVGQTSVTVKMPDTILGDTGGRFFDRFTGEGAIVRCPVSIVERV